jgi:hypothetical protein
VQAFYRDHLVGKFFPPDVAMTNVSRTVGQERNALLFFGDLPKSSCRQSSILINAMRYSLPLTSLSLL